MKPENPYTKGTLIWSVFEGDWFDLTAKQIGEVLGVGACTIRAKISKIKRDTGYDVPHVKGNQNQVAIETLKNNTWRNYRIPEIAAVLGVAPKTVYAYISKIESEEGIKIEYEGRRACDRDL